MTVALPFLAVTFPPITDLPQHVAQVRLLFDALGDPGSPYRVQWLTPYSLVYGVLALAWVLVEPIAGGVAAGRLGMLVVALAWVGAVHWLAARRGRPAAAAVLASALVFHHALYWGFASFLVGWPAFAIWFLLVARGPAPPGRGLREGLSFFGVAVLLYFAHALWLAAGLAWLAVEALWRRRRPGDLVPRLAGVAPVAVGAALWFAGIGGTAFATPPLWYLPQRRLSPYWLVDATFGGLTGALEVVAFVVLLGWLLAAVAGSRRALAERADRELALLGAFFLLAALLLPDKYTNTIEFNSRWMPYGFVALLLAAPPPRLPRRWATALAAGLLAVFVAVTTLAWRRFERVELAGLPQALAALPDEPRVLGLDYRRRSALLDRQAFLQAFAWSQVLHGGELNFSFADFPPSLVVHRERRSPPWTGGLEWYPQRLRPRDLDSFDHALVNAPPDLQVRIAADPRMEPVTAAGFWRLYRVLPEPPAVPQPP